MGRSFQRVVRPRRRTQEHQLPSTMADSKRGPRKRMAVRRRALKEGRRPVGWQPMRWRVVRGVLDGGR